jgi:ATP-dependent protease ClpP protease subunit
MDKKKIDNFFSDADYEKYKNHAYKEIEEIEKSDKRRSLVYSNYFNHVYLYDEINNFTVDKVINEMNILKRLEESIFYEGDVEKKIYSLPKPIALHLNSPGGSTNAGIALANYVTSSQIPIVVLGEGIVASAATFVLVSAKLSYIMKNTIVLIHQFFGAQSGKYEELKFQQEVGETFMKTMIHIYEKNSKLSKQKLREILYRDLYISSTEAIKWGLVHYLIEENIDKEYFLYNKKQFELYEPGGIRLGNTFQNVISLLKSPEEEGVYNEFNKSLNIVKYIHHLNYYTNSIPFYIYFTDMIGFDFFESMLELLPVLNAISISKVPSYGFVEGPINNLSIVLLVSLNRRFIYKKSYITLDFLTHQEPAYKFKDVLTNTEFMRNMIVHYFKTKTKLPLKIIDNIFTETYYFSAKDCLKYGIVDEILD